MLITLCVAIFLTMLFVILYNKRVHDREMVVLETAYQMILVDNFDLKMRDNVQSYSALERGMQEIEENYEVDRVGLVEQIQDSDLQIKQLQEKLQMTQDQLYNERNLCIDRQTVILFLNDELEEVKQAGLELQKHLDLHDATCLPVLNLSEQEERDFEDVNVITADGTVVVNLRIPTAEAMRRMDADLAEAMAKRPQDFAD